MRTKGGGLQSGASSLHLVESKRQQKKHTYAFRRQHEIDRKKGVTYIRYTDEGQESRTRSTRNSYVERVMNQNQCRLRIEQMAVRHGRAIERQAGPQARRGESVQLLIGGSKKAKKLLPAGFEPATSATSVPRSPN